MLGVPAVLFMLGVAALSLELPAVGVIAMLLSGFAFFAFAIAAWVLIFQARARLRRAEAALYAGDFETATREAAFVVRTVFRSDYQMGALFTLALSAERIGAFAEAGALFQRALEMVPAMAAHGPGRRARALLAAHAAISFAAAHDGPRAHAMLGRCHVELGAMGRPGGAFDALLDDSYMGAIGINSMLVELENRRDPRPLAVLATMLVAHRNGRSQDALAIHDRDRASIEHGLAPHERQLADRIRDEAMRFTAGAGPHRSAAQLEAPGGWAALVLPPG